MAWLRWCRCLFILCWPWCPVEKRRGVQWTVVDTPHLFASGARPCCALQVVGHIRFALLSACCELSGCAALLCSAAVGQTVSATRPIGSRAHRLAERTGTADDTWGPFIPIPGMTAWFCSGLAGGAVKPRRARPVQALRPGMAPRRPAAQRERSERSERSEAERHREAGFCPRAAAARWA